MKFEMPIQIDTQIIISEIDENGHKLVLRDEVNAIHNQNMARAIARGLAREPNHFIHRIAFGNGGTFVDAVGNILFNSPNVTNWAATLYNERYSEIVDESNVNFGTDPGSAGRLSDGSSPSDDPSGGGVTSYEAGEKSVVKVVMYLNENEPFGQLSSEDVGAELEDDEKCFYFDELGLFTSGLPGVATNGYTAIQVGNKLSDDLINLDVSTAYSMMITIDGEEYSATVTTPAGGSGALGELTFGDLCEGLNSDAWITAGDEFSTLMKVSITDRSGGTYPSIIGAQTFGFLAFESLTTGTSSTIELHCDSGVSNEIFNNITSGVCANVNVNKNNGKPAGAQNDSLNPENERERMLTHLIFTPLLKTAHKNIQIEYYLTISVPNTSDSAVSQIAE